MTDRPWYVTHPLTGRLLYTAATEKDAREWAGINARAMIVRVSQTK